MTEEQVAEPKTEKKGYINKLQDENETLKAQLAALQSQKAPEPQVKLPDDRDEIVEVTYGIGSLSPANPNCVYKKLMPKRDAFQALVEFDRHNEIKVLPREDFTAEPINRATCYIKFEKRDITGKILRAYKDVPLWIAAERIVNHPNYKIELVPKEEWLEYNKILAAEEKENNAIINKDRIAKALDTLGQYANS